MSSRSSGMPNTIISWQPLTILLPYKRGGRKVPPPATDNLRKDSPNARRNQVGQGLPGCALDLRRVRRRRRRYPSVDTRDQEGARGDPDISFGATAARR